MRLKTGAFAAIALAVGSTTLVAQQTTLLEEKLAIPRPLLIVPPDYPARALAEGRTAEIRMRGTVTKEGILESVVFSDRAEDQDFVEAIRPVVKMWRFVPGVDGRACLAVPLDAAVHVWFEIKDEKPAIFVSMPAAGDKTAAKEPDPKKTLLWTRRPKAVFPGSAWRAGMEGMALVLARVARDGEITAATPLVSSPVSEFGDEAVRATRRARYAPLDSDVWGARQSVCAQLDFHFCIGADAQFPMGQCRNRWR